MQISLILIVIFQNIERLSLIVYRRSRNYIQSNYVFLRNKRRNEKLLHRRIKKECYLRHY
jgi:hypothetical protein